MRPRSMSIVLFFSLFFFNLRHELSEVKSHVYSGLDHQHLARLVRRLIIIGPPLCHGLGLISAPCLLWKALAIRRTGCLRD